MDKLLTMSKKEWTRKQIMERIEERGLKQKEAAEMLGITSRQVRRLLKRYRSDGAEGLISRHRGKRSNHQIDPKRKRQAITLLHKHYADFGPTLASEKLAERHGVILSKETVRQMMIAEGLWKPKKRRKLRLHPLRQRRACVGELVQIDGSPHRWFEERAPACTCLIAVDDASSRLMAMYFLPVETTFGYFVLTEQYLRRHGLPIAFYSDKNSIFRVNQPQIVSGDALTQFGRALHQLGIEIICANTPQAKGRVERTFLTLQDRLVKELRLHNISTIQQANAFAPQFIADYNRRFAVSPHSAHDAHRPLTFTDVELKIIFSRHETRTISKELTIQYNKVIYQIQTKRPSYALRHAQVTVVESPLGEIAILYKGHPLDYTIFHRQPRQAEIVPTKQVNAHLDELPHKPPPDHPWRNYGFRINGRPLPHSEKVSS